MTYRRRRRRRRRWGGKSLQKLCFSLWSLGEHPRKDYLLFSKAYVFVACVVLEQDASVESLAARQDTECAIGRHRCGRALELQLKLLAVKVRGGRAARRWGWRLLLVVVQLT